jgi:hypothetical protein
MKLETVMYINEKEISHTTIDVNNLAKYLPEVIDIFVEVINNYNNKNNKVPEEFNKWGMNNKENDVYNNKNNKVPEEFNKWDINNKENDVYDNKIKKNFTSFKVE